MNAPPIIALHGFLGAPSVFDALSARLAGRRVHALLLPGHGPRPRAVPSRFEDAADELVAAIDESVGTAQVDLVGYSLGARLALAILARHPQRIRRAVLVSVHPGLRDEAARLARRAEDEANARAVEQHGLDAFVADWEARPLFASQRRLPEPVQAVQRAIRRAHDPAGIAAALRRLGLAEMPDYHDTLAQQAQRLALLVGEHDEKFRALALAEQARCRDLVVEIIPAAGHNPFLEAPRAIADRISALLAPTQDRPVPVHTPGAPT